MPTRGGHYCSILPSAGFDQKRYEGEDNEKQATVDGRRVMRLFGYKNGQEGSELIGFLYREKDGWASHAGEARAHCRKHEGEFEAMQKAAVAATDLQVVYEEEGPARSLVPIEATDSEPGTDLAEPRWYPLIPIGHFRHAVYGEFQMTAQDAERMVAQFKAGIPLGGGVPINEDGNHQRQAEAFGYIEDLEVRDDGVWGLVALSTLGREKVAGRVYRYLSPHFAPAGRLTMLPDGKEYDALLLSAALCNDPFFQQQPGLFAATVGYEFEPIQAAADNRGKQATGGVKATNPEVFVMSDEQKAALRAKYVAVNGEVTDEEWTALTEGLEDKAAWEAFAEAHGLSDPDPDKETGDKPKEGDQIQAPDEGKVTISKADFEKLQADAAQAKTLEQQLGEQKKELATVAATTGELQTQLRKTKLEETIRATVFGGKAPAPAAVDVLVALQMNPCEDTVKATMAHLAEHDGQIALVEFGERPGISATDGSGGDEELWMRQKGLASDAEARVRAIAKEKSCGLRDAYPHYLREIS